MDISAVVIARNEETRVVKTVESLKAQSIPLREIVLVNDGSTDGTGRIAENMGCIVIDLPYHEMSYVGRPELGQVLNHGLRAIREIGVPDYILQMGADHELPPDYLERMLSLMGDTVKIASGTYQNSGLEKDFPLGSGRLIDAKIWEEINGLQYPVKYGYESWIVYKYRQIGYVVKRYDEIVTITRPIRMYPKKAYEWGKTTFALGGSLPIVIVKALQYGFSGLHYIKGYFAREGVEQHLDIKDYVRKQQWNRALHKIKSFF